MQGSRPERNRGRHSPPTRAYTTITTDGDEHDGQNLISGGAVQLLMGPRNERRVKLFVVTVVIVVSVVCSLSVTPSAQSPRFRSRVITIPVTVTVTDSAGRLITGLTRDDFEVYEDGIREPITQFTDQRVPVSLGVVLDSSDSMRGEAIVDARGAVDRFVGELLQSDDEAFVATFNHSPRSVTPWKKPPATLINVLAQTRPTGGTAVYDALVAFSPLFEQRTNTRAAMVVVSDGADTASDRTLQQARDALRRSDAFVYAIAIDAPDSPASTRVNPDALREITGPSGGYTEIVRSAADLGPATARIADELNKQYTLAYSSSRRPDGRWRNIRVRVTRGEYLARSRRGYFAAPDPG
jgi:Ca-activated chloride channel homolog